MARRVIVAFRWGRVDQVGVVPDGQSDPTDEQLAEIAAGLPADPTGEPPRVRVIASAGWEPVDSDRWTEDPLDDYPGSPPARVVNSREVVRR